MNIKDFLYVDEIELNSILAQLENGLPTVLHDMQEALSGNQDSIKKSKGRTISGGVSAVATGSAAHQTINSENTIDIKQNISQQAIDTVYNDYAVNVIMKKLESNRLLKTTAHQEVGSFVELTSRFKIFNFQSMYGLLHNKNLSEMVANQDSGIDKDELANQLDAISSMSSMADIYSEILKHVDLISINNALIFAESKNFRMNSVQRKMLSLRKTKIRIFGIVESIVSEEDLDISNINGSDEDLSGLSEFYNRTNFFLISLLGKNIIKKDDRLIKPIAIYFE